MTMTRLDESSLRIMMSSDEDERLEFKRAVLSTKEITEYAVAIGNEGGGVADYGRYRPEATRYRKHSGKTER